MKPRGNPALHLTRRRQCDALTVFSTRCPDLAYQNHDGVALCWVHQQVRNDGRLRLGSWKSQHADPLAEVANFAKKRRAKLEPMTIADHDAARSQAMRLVAGSGLKAYLNLAHAYLDLCERFAQLPELVAVIRKEEQASACSGWGGPGDGEKWGSIDALAELERLVGAKPPV